MPISEDILISTVFLGIDHNYDFEGPPLLFETMVFNLPSFDGEYQERCSTWSEAEAMHDRAVLWAEEYLREKFNK